MHSEALPAATDASEGPAPPPQARSGFGPAFAVTFATLVALLGTAGVVADPWGQFGTQALPPLTLDAAAEKERRFQERGDVGLLVLGSSSAWSWPSQELAALGNGSFFNLAMPAGTLAHSARLLGQAGGHNVSRAIVGIDLAFSWEGALEAAPSMASATGRLDAGRVVEALFSYHHHRDAWRSLAYAVFGYPEDFARIDADGQVRGRQASLEGGNPALGPQEAAAALQPYGDAEWGPRGEAALAALVAAAGRAGIRLALVLQPVHPDLWPAAEAAGVPLAQLRQDVRAALQARCGGTVEAFDLGGLGLPASSFYDHLHYDVAGGRMALAALAKGEGALCGA